MQLEDHKHQNQLTATIKNNNKTPVSFRSQTNLHDRIFLPQETKLDLSLQYHCLDLRQEPGLTDRKG